MSSIDLTDLPIAWAAPPEPQDFSRVVRPQTGGPAYRVDRLGNRYQYRVQTPPMPIEPTGRYWWNKLKQAQRLGGIVAVRPVGFDPGAPGTPLLSAGVSSGRSLAIDGLTPNYVIRAGQPISVIEGGVRYFDFVVEEVAANSSGAATVTIHNLIRTPLSNNAVVELAPAKIEGTIEGDFGEWPVSGVIQFAFTVLEDQ